MVWLEIMEVKVCPNRSPLEVSEVVESIYNTTMCISELVVECHHNYVYKYTCCY